MTAVVLFLVADWEAKRVQRMTTAGASRCPRLSLQSKRNWSSLDEVQGRLENLLRVFAAESLREAHSRFEDRLRGGQGSKILPCLRVTSSRSLRSQVLWAHALHSRKQPLENLDPTPQWPWMSPFYCIPVTTYPPWRGPSSVQATVSSSAASLIPGAQHHCNDRRTEHAPGWLRALTGRCSGSFVGDMGCLKGSGRVCGGVSGALPFLSLRHTPLLSALYIGS